MAPEFLWDMQFAGNSDEGIVFFALRGPNTLINLQVIPEKLKDYQHSQKLLHLIAKVHAGNYDAEEDFIETISDQCHQALKHYAKIHPANSVTQDEFTLQDYYGVKVVCLELFLQEGALKLRPTRDQIPQRDLLPELALSQVTASSRISVPLVDAARVNILPRSWDIPEEHTITDPTLVQVQGEDGKQREYHFKPSITEEAGLRELKILLHLKEKPLDSRYRASSIAAIVHYTGQPSRILGYLLDPIDHDRTLADYIYEGKALQTLKDRWRGQIRDTVIELHKHSIIWGGAHPANVLIDHQLDAWIVGFSGTYDPAYVDHDKADTIAGDLQGVERIIQAMEKEPTLRANRAIIRAKY